MLLEIILLILGLAAGSAGGYTIRKGIAKRNIESVEAKAEILLNEAKNKQKELLYQAKEKAIQIIDQSKREEIARQNELMRLRERLEKRESLFDQKLLSLESKQQKILDKAKQIEDLKQSINQLKEDQQKKLLEISGLSKESAKELLLKLIEDANSEQLMLRIQKLQNTASEELEKKSKDILSRVVQRCAVSHATEITTTTVDLPNDEMKGRIIGRDGRNIKTIEQLTGTEIVVDDTPMAITISGFSPIRRHIAKKALEKLILDGRIHPTKIEDAIKSAKEEIALDIKKAGEEASYNLGIAGLDPKLVQIVGRLKYRTSYGQNVLQHSIEVAHLSALLAEELDADVTVAKKAGFLHDIGKSVDHEVKGTHPEIGRDIAKKFNLPDEIIAPILTHHDDAPPTLEAVIVKVADAISGARPGARKDTYENYLQRLGELENIATSFEGVEKSYAIQAGREVRIFVKPEEINDLQAHKLAKAIAKKIEEELKYPGEIKVNVIREMRILEYAR